MSTTPQILVVEDDDAIRALLTAALRREPFDVHSAANGAQALTMTKAADYAVILLDLMMPTLNGLEFLEAFHELFPKSRLPANMVHGIVRKPFDVPQLVAMVREVALTRGAQTRETAMEAAIAEMGAEAPQTDPPN